MNMASSSSSPIFLIIIFSMSLLISCSKSTEHVVGDGVFTWMVPLSSPDALTLWASSHNFTVGDTIVFQYDTHRESVREVINEHDYRKCNMKGPYVRHSRDGGNTEMVLDKAGVHYFMSGWKGHCKRGLKLAIDVVMSDPTITNDPLVSQIPSMLLRPALSLPLAPSSLPVPSPSPSPSLSPSSNSSDSKSGGAIGHGCIMWLGVSWIILTM